jgi:acetylornithine deacetylase/succinyl-diaminopimelate desuccinylase-like protein
MIKQYADWFEKNREHLLEDFFSYLKFPSVSTDPSRRKDLLACKDWLLEYMKSCGLEVDVWETSGYPTVFGQYQGGKGPTLLFYGHYDVQPEAPLDEWKSPPFEPEVRDGAVYARGAIDNKGQNFYTLVAIRAFLEQAQNININLKVLIEGEEEIGSFGLEELLDQKKQELKADAVFIVDLDMYEKGIPAVTLGTRGIVNLNVTIRNTNADLHSGVFGGMILNPARALVTTLGKMWNEKGEVTVPGFYEGVKQLTREEYQAFDWELDPKKEAAPFYPRVYQKEGEFSLLESNWIRPTLEINGFESGYTHKGFKTIIPAQAMAKLSCRLVPNQDPAHVMSILETFLKENLPEGIEIEIEKGHGTPGVMASVQSKVVKCASQAYETVYRTKCRRKLCGATIPIAGMLAKTCEGDLVMMGVGLGSDRMHAPNECFGLDRFKEGFLSITQILEIFARGDSCG